MNTKQSTIIRSLDPHQRLRIQATFWKIDSWNQDKINFDIDGIRQSKKEYQFSNSAANLCGMPQYDDQVDSISLEFDHKQNSAFIKISAIDLNGDNNESWGIQKFQVYILECRYNFLNKECYDYCDYLSTYSFFTTNVFFGYEGWSGDLYGISSLNTLLNAIHYHYSMRQTLTLPVHTYLKLQFYGSGIFQLYIDAQLILSTYVNQFQYFQLKTYNIVAQEQLFRSKEVVFANIYGIQRCQLTIVE